jgi:hypothetical protein
MANVKITDLTAASTPLAGTELFETVQGGDSKKVAASAIGNSATALPFASVSGRAYAAVHSDTDQTGSVSAATAVKFETTDLSQGITVANNGSGNPTRITFAAAGVYSIATRLQFKNTDTNDHDVTVWGAKNGTNISASATAINVPKAADGGAQFFQIVFYLQVAASDYVEALWLPENVAVTVDFTAAGAIAPSVPSAILVVERIA